MSVRARESAMLDNALFMMSTARLESTIPTMGGPVRVHIDADPACGRIDMALAPGDAPFGPPLPIRVIPNGDGVDVLFTLTRFPGQPDEEWGAGLEGMRRELENLRRRHERAGN